MARPSERRYFIRLFAALRDRLAFTAFPIFAIFVVSTRFTGLRDRSAEKRFFRVAALPPKGARLPRVQLRSLLGEERGGPVRERQVEVVAAEQKTIPNRQAIQNKVAVLFFDANQREVGRSAPDVANERDVADGQLFAPSVAFLRQPSVRRRRRFFEENQRLRIETGADRRFPSQFPRAFVERRRNGQNDLLFENRRVRERVVPSGGKVRQVSPRRFDRRNPRRSVGRAPGQNRLATVDSGMRQPRLRRNDRSLRRLGGSTQRDFADEVKRVRIRRSARSRRVDFNVRTDSENLAKKTAFAAFTAFIVFTAFVADNARLRVAVERRFVPRQTPIGQPALFLRADVQRRRQRVATLDRRGRDKLRNFENARLAAASLAVDRQIRQLAIRRSQVDPDDVFRRRRKTAKLRVFP